MSLQHDRDKTQFFNILPRLICKCECGDRSTKRLMSTETEHRDNRVCLNLRMTTPGSFEHSQAVIFK